MWKAIRENPRAVAYAVLMHLVLLVLLLFSLDWTPKAIKPGTKQPIQAALVDSKKLKAVEDRKQAEQRQLVAEKRKQEQQRKAEAEQKRKLKAEQAANQKAAVERKQKTEQAAKQKAATERKQKAEAAAKKKADAERKQKAAAAAKKKAEAERKQQAEAARQREAEQALQAQLAEEQAQVRAQHALAEFIPYIQDKIQRNWLRPAGSPGGLTCLIRVGLIPGGEVVSANVIRSSGDPLFDRSVETAVLKASPLPLPGDAALFKYFREINFKFSPSG